MSYRAASPAQLACRQAVSEAIHDLASGDRVLVACSGGPDSLELVAAARWAGERAGVDVAAVVIDHGLQSDSADVAREAVETCELLGVPARSIRVEVGSAGGPEAAARQARYEALESAAIASGSSTVLLGHTLEDQAETVLLRLARGSGARSLAAMAPINGRWRRPFLALPRATVRAAADEALAGVGRVAWADPHNEDAAFARVRVRALLGHLTDALGEGVVLGLTRSADLLRDDAEALEAIAVDAWTRLVGVDDGTWCADCDELATLPAAIRSRVIRSMALAAGSPADALGVDHVRVIDALITDWHGQGSASLPGGVSAERSCGRLCLHSSSPGLE